MMQIFLKSIVILFIFFRACDDHETEAGLSNDHTQKLVYSTIILA